MRILVGLLVAGALAGCSMPIPLLGVALDGKVDVQILAKVTNNSGQVLPVANTPFGYEVLEKDAADAKVLRRGTFKTDFDGKATIRLEPSIIAISGNYAILNGISAIEWAGVRFKVDPSFREIRLSNSNGTVTNDN